MYSKNYASNKSNGLIICDEGDSIKNLSAVRNHGRRPSPGAKLWQHYAYVAVVMSSFSDTLFYGHCTRAGVIKVLVLCVP